MKSPLSRRDFLKAAGMLPLGVGLSPLLRGMRSPGQQAGPPQNVLVVVFDAFSAYHISMHGYARPTTPNLERLSQRAVVYHNHYAGANFTTPGTASLLTGSLPWSHRAFHLNGNVAQEFIPRTFFGAFPNHYRIAYSHNPTANALLQQFSAQIDEYVPWSRLMLTADTFIDSTFRSDQDIADVGWIRSAKRELEGYSYSLFFSHLYERYMHNKVAAAAPNFPRGLPSIRGDNYFLLSEAMDWLEAKLGQLPEPYMGYFHFMPPHAPYTPVKEYYRLFAGDSYVPAGKPDHMFSPHLPQVELVRKRMEYDEFIVNVDQEFARLYDSLEASGRLANTWLVLTSDHGELFERGLRGHGTPLLYQGVNRVPLMIFEPGRTSRLDIDAPTSAADVLPTLTMLAGGQPAAWTDGQVLPPFPGSQPDPNRGLFVVRGWNTDTYEPIREGTVSLTKGSLKLIYYFGYPELAGRERIELYDLDGDPEELRDLSSDAPAEAGRMTDEVETKLSEVNRPYL